MLACLFRSDWSLNSWWQWVSALLDAVEAARVLLGGGI